MPGVQAGEQSGDIIFLDYNTTGDGLITALQTLAIMRRTGKRLSELLEGFERLPQVLINVPVTKKTPIEELPTLVAAIRKAEEDFAGNGRVLIRYSGTESKARVMVEGNDTATVTRVAESLADELRRALGGS